MVLQEKIHEFLVSPPLDKSAPHTDKKSCLIDFSPGPGKLAKCAIARGFNVVLISNNDAHVKFFKAEMEEVLAKRFESVESAAHGSFRDYLRSAVPDDLAGFHESQRGPEKTEDNVQRARPRASYAGMGPDGRPGSNYRSSVRCRS